MTVNLSLDSSDLAEPLSPDEAQKAAAILSEWSNMTVYPASLSISHKSLFFLGRKDQQKFLGVLSGQTPVLDAFDGLARSVTVEDNPLTVLRCPMSATNAAALRGLLPFLVAETLDLQKSAGTGDRLGLATPGHIRAFRSSFAETGKQIAPILAQQSIRENARTGRTPQDVMDDAIWGVLQAGWRDGFGADADHLKNTDDIDVCVAAGYTFYTIDPGEYVDNEANYAPQARLLEKAPDVPWAGLDTDLADLKARLLNKPIDLGNFSLTISEEELLRAAVKYGPAVAHTVKMYRHLAQASGDKPFEFEMSVDETETITTLAEHVYIVNELRRLGVKWVSLAPRYVGEFEKGVDYIGDLAEFEKSFAGHFAVSQAFGPYKLSIHSGSDKFSIYPVAAKVAGDLLHLKTAGTSYLEALRAIAQLDPDLFREIADFAVERYPTDRASYHVSAEISNVPDYHTQTGEALMGLLDQFDAREILHVTFGSVLNDARFRDRFFSVLRHNEDVYTRILQKHFHKHLTLFS